MWKQAGCKKAELESNKHDLINTPLQNDRNTVAWKSQSTAERHRNDTKYKADKFLWANNQWFRHLVGYFGFTVCIISRKI